MVPYGFNPLHCVSGSLIGPFTKLYLCGMRQSTLQVVYSFFMSQPHDISYPLMPLALRMDVLLYSLLMSITLMVEISL